MVQCYSPARGYECQRKAKAECSLRTILRGVYSDEQAVMGFLIINTCLFAESGTEVDAGGLPSEAPALNP